MQLIENMKLRTVTRVQYANLESKNVWEKKIDNAFDVFNQLELATVVHDVRPAMIAHFKDPFEMHTFMYDMAKLGLYVVPLRKEDASNDFSHVATEFDMNSGGEYTYRCVLSKSKKVAEEFVDATFNNDDIKIGELLGFPKKSCEFFDKVWQQGYHDPIWQQAENTSEENINFRKTFKDSEGNIKQHLICIKASDENYIISAAMRYLNVRILSHIPYSFDDEESIEVAKKWLALARELNLSGLDDLLDILRLPYEWDCYKGYVEINTPVFKIVNQSVPCFPRYTVWQESDFYPKEAPYGIKFPWKNKMFS